MSESNVHDRRVRERQRHRERAHLRLRNRVQGTAERPRLAVFKSIKHVYAQVIDDLAGRTLATASTVEPAVRAKLAKGATSDKAAARAVGEVVADRAKEKGITRVVFDRGGYIYHGKVKEVADAARKQGLDF